MAKQVFEVEPTSTGSIPFLDNYILDNPDCDGMDYEVLSIKETRKRSGYMLVTKEFQVLLWKSDELCPLLVDFLERMETSNPGYLLGVTVDAESVSGFSLYSDQDVPKYWTREKKRGGLLAMACGTKKGSRKKNLTL